MAKVSSTPGRPWQAVVDAILASGIDPNLTTSLTLGTTVGTNAVLQRRGARVIYVTTSGFEDIPFIQRIQRKHLYDLQWQKPEPFCRRQLANRFHARHEELYGYALREHALELVHFALTAAGAPRALEPRVQADLLHPDVVRGIGAVSAEAARELYHVVVAGGLRAAAVDEAATTALREARP